MKANLEKRRFPRLAKNLPVRICAEDFDIVTKTYDISGNGAYCKVNRYIPPLTKLKIFLFLSFSLRKVAKIQCEGVVVRINEIKEKGFLIPAYNVAIYFNKIQNKDINKINRYIAQHL